MKRFVCSTIIVALGLFFAIAAMPSNSPCLSAEPLTVTWTEGGEKSPTSAPTVRVMKFREGLNFKQRRAMGLTFRNVRRVIAEGQASGEISEDMTTAEVAVYVSAQLVTENPEVYADPQLDWDAILAFLERLIPLIMQLISLFS